MGFWVLLVTLAGCKSEEPPSDKEWQNHVSQYAHIYCDLRSTCDNDFDDEFGDQEQCRKEVLINENKGRELRVENDCEFKAKESRECLDTLTVMSCQEWLDGDLDAACGRNLWSCD